MKKSITSLDLNLLLCLQLLMQERSVTRAAKRLSVTPSAISKSLAKLRAWFDDSLFVNTPQGLIPTPLMVSMEQDLADWMQMGNQLLDNAHHETPSGLKFELVVELPLMMIMFNALSQQIYHRYPQAAIRLHHWDYDALDAITRGSVDIGFTGRESYPRSREQLNLPLSIDCEVLFYDFPRVWLREDHPALQEEWNLETFLRYPHVSIYWEQSDTWALDDILREMGRKRDIALSLPGFEQSLFMAAQPGHSLLTTAPGYCRHYSQLHHLPLVSRPIPFDSEILQKMSAPYMMIWHKRNRHNPKIVWLRQAIKALYADLSIAGKAEGAWASFWPGESGYSSPQR